MYVYGQKVVKFWNSLLEKEHSKYLEPLGYSAAAEYRNPLKVRYRSLLGYE